MQTIGKSPQSCFLYIFLMFILGEVVNIRRIFVRYTLATAYSNIGWVLNQVGILCLIPLQLKARPRNSIIVVIDRMSRCVWCVRQCSTSTSASSTAICVETACVRSAARDHY